MPKPWSLPSRFIFSACLAAAGPAPALTPEAREVLDILDARVAAAQAGQASRDAFLEALEGRESGCGDWKAAPFWRKDPDLRTAVEEVCPDIAKPKPRRRAASGAEQDGFALRAEAAQSIHPAEKESEDPFLAASARTAWGGAEAAFAGAEVRKRRLEWRKGDRFRVQAGQLDFRSSAHLDFLTGRHAWPGSSFTSGLEGPLEARSARLDGMEVSWREGPWEASAFGTWNRRERPGTPDGDPLRQDASVLSLGAGFPLGPWAASAQGIRARLESSGAAPATAWAGGLSAGPVSGLWRLGAGASFLDTPGGRPPEDPSPGAAPGTPSSGGGAFAEALLADSSAPGKPASYLLEWRQATAGWASPLSSAPAYSRDTLDGSWVLPGRGEGGLRVRSRLDILPAGRPRRMGSPGRPWSAALLASGEAGWDGDGPLAGDGRLGLSLGHGNWTWDAAQGLRWRQAALPAGGSFRSAAAGLAWSQGGWRARAYLSRQGSGGQGKAGRRAWPLSLEAGRQDERGSWKAGLAFPDAAEPLTEAKVALRQRWRLGRGVALEQALRLPWEGDRIGRELAFQVGLEAAR